MNMWVPLKENEKKINQKVSDDGHKGVEKGVKRKKILFFFS